MACVPFYPDDERGLGFFANNFLNQKKIKISREILNIILERARGDRSNLKNELEKIEFAGWATREGNDGGVEKTAKLMNKLLAL